MSDAAYSLRAVVADGIVTAPRWYQHAAKLMLHGSASGAVLCIAAAVGPWRPVLATILAGPVLLAVIKLYQHLIPRLSRFAFTRSHVGDLATDGALATLPVAFSYLARREWIPAVCIAGACVAFYAACHREARP